MSVMKSDAEKLKGSGPGRPKDESKSMAILQAAGALFMQHGMSRVTMDDIAKEAGVSKLTVYNHFGSKEDLFQTMIRNKCETHMSDEMFESLSAEDPQADLEKIGHGFVDVIYSPEALAMYRTVMSEARHDKDIAELYYQTAPQRLFNYLEKYLARLEKKRVIEYADKHRAADIFFSLFKGDMHMKVALGLQEKPGKKSMQRFVEENVSSYLKLYLV